MRSLLVVTRTSLRLTLLLIRRLPKLSLTSQGHHGPKASQIVPIHPVFGLACYGAFPLDQCVCVALLVYELETALEVLDRALTVGLEWRLERVSARGFLVEDARALQQELCGRERDALLGCHRTRFDAEAAAPPAHHVLKG